jgi:hypothetical protein
MGLQTTVYATLMTGSINGPVVVPGDPEASKLWEMIGSGKMPLTGPLPMDQRQLIYDWIKAGAAERRAPPVPAAPNTPARPLVTNTGGDTWLAIGAGVELESVPDACAPAADQSLYVSSDLILPISCGAIPNEAALTAVLAKVGLAPAVANATQKSLLQNSWRSRRCARQLWR